MQIQSLSHRPCLCLQFRFFFKSNSKKVKVKTKNCAVLKKKKHLHKTKLLLYNFKIHISNCYYINSTIHWKQTVKHPQEFIQRKERPKYYTVLPM